MSGAAPEPPAKVLVVDDNEANRALALHTLGDEGYVVVVAKDGQEGIRAFEREAPDCVLLDVRMPGLDGFAVCERIRALPHGPETPVVFLTALRDIDTFDRALRAGGDDFLGKPIRPTELVVRVQTAIQLRRMRAELREHYDLLKRHRDDLLRLQLQKERLMAFVVHDLKNPVNVMDLHAQVLLRDPASSEATRRSAGQIRAAARQLNRMILNLLDLSKGDEGKIVAQKTAVALPALLEELAVEFDESARERRVTLRAASRIDGVEADPDLLRRTLANLVENAIRHAPPETTVTVSARNHQGAAEIRVADQGGGIPAEMRERIFDPFVQIEGDGRPRTLGGRGLGLTFCKLAVEAHGGTISIEDGAPGAVFVVRVPDES
jgi:two-component system sensor histidine kinase/response regulator